MDMRGCMDTGSSWAHSDYYLHQGLNRGSFFIKRFLTLFSCWGSGHSRNRAIGWGRAEKEDAI